MLPIVHHPGYVPPLRPGHPFPMSKYGYLKQALLRRRLLQPGRYLAPKPATAAQIAMAHAPDYVDRAFGLRLGDDEIRRIGLDQTDRLLERVRPARCWPGGWPWSRASPATPPAARTTRRGGTGQGTASSTTWPSRCATCRPRGQWRAPW